MRGGIQSIEWADSWEVISGNMVRKRIIHFRDTRTFFLTVVLYSGPNGFSFLSPYKLSILARGKNMFEAGVGKRFGKRD